MRDSEDDSDCGAAGLDEADAADEEDLSAEITMGSNSRPHLGFEESKAGFKIGGCSAAPL